MAFHKENHSDRCLGCELCYRDKMNNNLWSTIPYDTRESRITYENTIFCVFNMTRHAAKDLIIEMRSGKIDTKDVLEERFSENENWKQCIEKGFISSARETDIRKSIVSLLNYVRLNLKEKAK
jgi:hypothetical protein